VRVLTIDTATSVAAIGLVIDGNASDAPPVRSATAAQHVLASLDAILAANHLTIGDVDRIVVGRGPGSFTGQRIGLATAIGLAAPHATQLAGATTTAALRHAAGPDAVAMVDARRGEVFAEGPGVELSAYRPEDLVARLDAGTLLVGDGAVRYRDMFEHCTVPADDSALHVPAAAALAALGEGYEPATPIYVREPDAVRIEDR
jgi:tRNA threonylcarbamoyladenosine biosynthesis protein TsaB